MKKNKIRTYLQNRKSHSHREQTCACQGGRGQGGMDWEFGIMQTITWRMDKQQGLTVQPRELHSISCDKL